jgi:hypothetical protein
MSQSWHVPRRTFLRGLGTVMALPMLESMLPSIRLFADEPVTTSAGFPKRMAFVYIPNGADMTRWTPAATGSKFDLSYTLQPLQTFKDKLTILSNMDNNNANELGDGGGGHARASASYLTGVHPRKTAGADIHTGVSVDQIAAAHLGDQTKVPSLELSCDRGQRAGTCDSGYSCAYQFNISWKSPTMPMNPEVDPRQAFERLFGSDDSAQSKEAQAKRQLYNKSVLDFVLDDASRLQNGLGDADRQKLSEYFDAVRDLERRIEDSEKYVINLTPEQRQFDIPADYNFAKHTQLMFDIMALAFQTDATRVSTFILGHDGSNRPYPQIGIPEGHHDLSHHRNDQAKIDKLAMINRYHVTLFSYFLNKLDSVKEGDGTLLDNCMVVYGGGLSNGNEHTPENLPVVVAGGGGGAFSSGRHFAFDSLTPMTNLYISMLDSMGVPTEKIGDSTGKLDAIIAKPA